MRKLLLAGLLALGVALVPGATLAAVTQNESFPLTITEANPCNGDVVTFNGTAHLVVAETSDGSGGFHERVGFNVSDITGVSADGTVYHGGGGNWYSVNVGASSLPMEQTFTNVFLMISSGSAPNFTVTITQHETINPDGTVTTYIDREDFACRG